MNHTPRIAPDNSFNLFGPSLPTPPSMRPTVSAPAFVLLSAALSACASGARTATTHTTTPEPLVCAQLSPTLTCSYVGIGRFTIVHIGRFTVGFDAPVARSADAAGASLIRDVTKDLTRIMALLSGPLP